MEFKREDPKNIKNIKPEQKEIKPEQKEINFYLLLREHLAGQAEKYNKELEKMHISPKDLSLDFYYLAKKGCTDLIREMIETSVDVITPTSINKSLMVAVKNNDLKTTSYLLSVGADINYKNLSNGKKHTPLFIAIANDNLDIVNELLKYPKCDTYKTDSSGDTILLHAIKSNADVSIVDRLQSLPNCRWLQTTHNIFDNFPLYAATNSKIIKSLIDHGAPVNQIMKCGSSPIFQAVRQRNKEAVKMLIDAGCQINCKTVINETPLLRAVYSNWPCGVRILLEAGALIDFGLAPKQNEKFLWNISRKIDFRPEIEQANDKIAIEKLLEQWTRQIRKDRTYILLLGRKDPNSGLRVLPIDMIAEISRYI